MRLNFRLILLATAVLLFSTNATLQIASALSVIEWTPEKIAAEDFYNGSVVIVNGGVPNLFTNSSIDLASNAETQALRNFANHTNLRIIYTISEVAYRIVADHRKIKKLEDLRGKKVGALAGTSAGYFVERYLASVGLEKGKAGEGFEVINGSPCLKEPCGNGTLPYLLKAGKVDAVGLWEPTVELAARAIGKDNAIFFQDSGVYREIFNLHTTTQKLADPAKRKEIVDFVQALEKALEMFRKEPERVYKRAAKAVDMEEGLLRDVWDVHRWPGMLPRDLLDVLVEEDGYVAGLDKRSRLSRESLTSLVDRSILDEVKGEK